MSEKTFVRKKYTLLVRKLTIEHDMQFASLSRNAGMSTNIKTSSECLLNQQIPFIVYDDGSNDSYVQLHVLTRIANENIQLGMISFDAKNQKILKPLSKQFFSKQFANKRGYIQYKFIGVENKTVLESEMAGHIEEKNNILLSIQQHAIQKEEVQNLMALINEKDEVINKMNDQIQKLIKQTKKLNKSLSKEKSTQQIQRNISLNVKLNQNLQTANKNIKSTNNLWEKEKDEYEYQIQKLSRRIRDLQNRQRQYKQQIQSLRKKIEIEGQDNQKKISDLRKQIQYRYDKQSTKQNKLITQSKSSENDLQTEREKKNKYIQEQLAEQIRRIQAQKQKQLKKDFELQLKLQLEKQTQRQKQRERQRQKEKQRDKQIQRFKQKQKQREKSKAYLRQSHAEQHKQLLKQMQELDNDRIRLKQKLQIKDDQINNFVIKLERAQKQISKLEDQNIQLRKTKSTLLREVEGMTFKNQPNEMKSSLDNKPIFEYEKMILNERKQINDQKLKAQIDELRSKIKRDEKQFKQKLQQKDMQIMRLKLSEKSASRQKQIYSNRIKQIMENVQGDRKNFLQALQNAHKFQTQQSRTKQLQLQKNQLQANNHKLAKQKQQLQNALKKYKSKIDEREGQWVLLKSIEAQHDYYKTQCQKFQKANKKFQKQYESIKEYCLNLEHIVGKKPRKTMDDQLNTQREQRYKNQIRSRLQVLMQQVSDMENKFYVEQVQIWLTERTNIIQYYAKKFEADKLRIQDMDNINQQAKNNLIKQKEKQINELKQQQIIDIDRKIAKLKLLVRSDEHKLVTSMIDKASIEQAISELNSKLVKLTEQEQVRKKQVNDLKLKNAKLQTDLKQKTARVNFAEENPQKKSISLFPEGDVSKIQDVRKSYLDQFKKSRDFYMNKPFQQLKKINAELQAEKRRIQTEMNTLRFNFDKEKVQLNDKIRTKQRQYKKLEHQLASNEKIVAKLNGDIQTLKKHKQDYDSSAKKLKEQLRQVSRTLQLKQRQCSEALSQIKRMQKNLQMYEQAEKKMFEDVKKMKQKLQKKQTQMEGILDERIQKSKQIDTQRLIQISKLEERVKQLEQKLQREITDSLNIKNENQKLAQLNTEYDVKLKEKQQQNQAIKQQFDMFKTEQIEKSNELQNQNNLLQHNIMQIAQQIAKKQQQCYEYQIKIEYSQKRQQALKTLREQLQQEIKQLKNDNQSLTIKLKQQYDQIMEQEKNMKAVKYRVDSYAEDLAKSQLKIEDQLKINQMQRQQIHEYEKETIRLELQKKNLQNKIQFLNENYKEKIEQVKKLEIYASQKQMEIQKIMNLKSGKSINQDKSRKSSEGFDLSPGSPSVRNKLNTSIHKSTSLIQQPKSSKNINSSSMIRKSSSKQKEADDSDHIKYSKQGIEINFLRPVQESADDLKGTLAIPKKQAAHESSKVDIDVNESDEQNPKKTQGGNLAISKNKQIPLDQKATPQRPIQLQREFDSQEEIQNELSHNHQLNERDYEAQIAELQEKIQNMKIQIEQITEQRDGYLSQLLAWKNTYERESNAGSQILIKQTQVDRIKQAQNNNNSSLQKSQQSDILRKPQLKKAPSYRSNVDINQQFDKSNVKKAQVYQKQIQQLRSKLIEYEMAVTENENHIRQLQQGLANEQASGEKLISEIQDTMQKLQNEVNANKKLQEQMNNMEHELCQKIVQLEKQIEQMIIQDMKKDQTLKQTMKIVEDLNEEIRQKDAISQTLQNQISKLKSTLDKTNKILNGNKSEYRKYQEQAQLQILRLKETTDDLNASLTDKSHEVIELTQRFVELQQKLNQAQQQIRKKQHMVLVQRSKIKDAFDRRDQVMDEMKKFDGIKATLMDKVGDLEIRLGQKNEQLKQLTKQTAITYKKYEIQIQTQKEEHSITRKKLKQRQQHITNLKMQLANYNDTCHDLQKQKNGLITQLNKVEKQLREIMKTYQAELDQLNKDKLSFAKQVQRHQQVDKQNQLKIDVMNKQIAKKNREIKELTFKIEDQQNGLQKLKERHRKEVGDLIADIQIRNNEFHKIKIQLQRQTEHYFSKEVEYLADREKKEKLETQYNIKLQSYEKTIKQMQQQLKDIKNRPSVDQWEEVCFQNELYKNRVDELEAMLRDNGEQQEERILAQFKRYKVSKERQVQDMQSEMEKYRSKFHSLEETNYVLKKDNDSMKVQLRTVMQEKMRIQKSLKEHEEDLKEIKEQLSFYKAKRVDDLNKLLNETYD